MPITTWGRLEPDTEALDPSEGLSRGLTNRLGDPLWLLSRQHSLGELRGEDAGVPVAVELICERHPVTALTIDGVTAPVSPGVPWEAEVEAEPDQVDLRLRLRGGELLAALLADAGLGAAVAMAPGAFAWQPDAPGHDATTVEAALLAAARRWADGAAVARAYEAGTFATALGLGPDDLVAGAKVGAAWHRWWSARARVRARTAWQADRLEHHFVAEAPTAAGTVRLAAERYPGGRLDWDAFQVATIEPVGAVAPVAIASTCAPLPLAIPGMPTARVWALEDDGPDVGRVSIGPGDLGAALLVEVALAYAGDWFVAPVALTAGALHRLTSVQVTDSFGVRSIVRAAAEVRPDPAWGLWRLTGDADGWLFIPAATATTVMGDPIEDVVLLRDELANAGWAIERVVPDALGRGRPTMSGGGTAAVPTAPSTADWRYAPLPRLPGDRVPLLRQSAGDGAAHLVRAQVVDPAMGAPATAGRIVAMDFAVREVELQRRGAVVTRRWQLAQDAAGGRRVWCTRAREAARPAAGVRLGFDELVAASMEGPTEA